MNALFLHRLVPVALCAMAAHAAGQPTAPVGRSPAPTDPTDAKAAVPALRYESSLARPRPPNDEASVAWREANDAAARIGGWRTYARMAQAPNAAASAASPSVSSGAQMSPGHGGKHSGPPHSGMHHGPMGHPKP